jgi:hypothetical protein
VLDQVVLGAGFGLLSTPLLVGIQSVVEWSDRGVVTSGNMFTRYLGQSLGAAIFGAIFNAGIVSELSSAPASLQHNLPHELNQLVSVLHDPSTSDSAKAFLRHAIYIATHHIYVGITGFAVITLLVVLIAPRKFPIVGE